MLRTAASVNRDRVDTGVFLVRQHRGRTLPLWERFLRERSGPFRRVDLIQCPSRTCSMKPLILLSLVPFAQFAWCDVSPETPLLLRHPTISRTQIVFAFANDL